MHSSTVGAWIDCDAVWPWNMGLAFLEKLHSLHLSLNAYVVQVDRSHSWMITLTCNFYVHPATCNWKAAGSFPFSGTNESHFGKSLTEVKLDDASWRKKANHLTECFQGTHLTLDKPIIKQCGTNLMWSPFRTFRHVWIQPAFVDQHFWAQLSFWEIVLIKVALIFWNPLKPPLNWPSDGESFSHFYIFRSDIKL